MTWSRQVHPCSRLERRTAKRKAVMCNFDYLLYHFDNFWVILGVWSLGPGACDDSHKPAYLYTNLQNRLWEISLHQINSTKDRPIHQKMNSFYAIRSGSTLKYTFHLTWLWPNRQQKWFRLSHKIGDTYFVDINIVWNSLINTNKHKQNIEQSLAPVTLVYR